ncbi:MAG: glycosyltransferase family 10 [Pseudomonadota bacterium]
MSAIDRSLKHVDIIASPNRVVFAVCEPATRFHANIHKAQGEHTIVLTHNRDYIENPPGNRQYIEAAALCPTWTVERNYDYLRTNHVTEKTHLLSWVTSNASIMPQHRYRLRFLQKLKQSTLPLDLYGRGFSPIADKWNGIAPYRYSIAFENAFMENYVTEKIMDCFVAETMPLYVGAPNVTDFFPKESMVIIDPDDPDIIRILEDIVHSDRYKKNRDAILEAKRIVLEECNTTARIARFVSSYKAAPLPKKPIRIYRRHQDWTGSEDVEYDRHKGYVPK